MSVIQVMSYGKEFPSVNLKMQKDDPMGYEYSLLILYSLETDKGFKVKKIGKTTVKGTKVTYEPIKDKEAAIKYKELLESKVKDFNNKYKRKLNSKKVNTGGRLV